MVLRIPICPENYDMIYRTIDLRSAYTIVKENASALPEEDTDRKEQVMLEARQHRDMAVKAVRKGEINVVDWYISKLCTLAAQVNLR